MSRPGRTVQLLGTTVLLLTIQACRSATDSGTLSNGITIAVSGPDSSLSGMRVTAALRVADWSKVVGSPAIALRDSPMRMAMAGPGDLSISLVVQGTGSPDTIAVFDRVAPVLIDHDYSLTLHADEGNPRDFPWVICHPDVQSAQVRWKPRGLESDSLYLTWFGLPRGAVC